MSKRGISKQLLNAITKHIAALQAFSDEREYGDGIWIYTLAGWAVECKGLHTLHTDTCKEMIDLLEFIIPCDCKECQDILQSGKKEKIDLPITKGNESK